LNDGLKKDNLTRNVNPKRFVDNEETRKTAALKVAVKKKITLGCMLHPCLTHMFAKHRGRKQENSLKNCTAKGT